MKIRNIFLAGTVIFLGLIASCTKDKVEITPTPVVPIDTTLKFSEKVYPIFAAHSCTGCHGTSGGLTLTGTATVVRQNLITVGAVVPNSSATSKLYTNFNGVSHKGKTISTTELTNIKTWIDLGAKDN